LLNALHLAIGEEAQQAGRCEVSSTSGPSDSFKKYWRQHGVRVWGLNAADNSRYDLSIAESHTRVTAWRQASPRPRVPETQVERPPASGPLDVLEACKAGLLQNDIELVEAALANSGRYWIESSVRDEARQLFINVQRRFGSDKRASLLARFLNALPELFNDRLDPSEFSEETERMAEKHNLGLLIRAERMEHARKTGQISRALELGNSLLPQVTMQRFRKSIRNPLDEVRTREMSHVHPKPTCSA
jgi:hypothetical protein